MMNYKRRITKSYFDFATRKYIPLINRLAYKIGGSLSLVEELQSQGMTELLKCMICYDGRSSFMTFLYGRLDGIFRHVRDVENKTKRIKKLPIESIANLIEQKYDYERSMEIEEYLSILNELELNIIKELFFGSRTLREVSIDHKFIVSTTHQIKTKAITKMSLFAGVNHE